MLHKIIRVEANPHAILALVFDDGTTGEISLSDRLFGPMFESLKTPDFLNKPVLMLMAPCIGLTMRT